MGDPRSMPVWAVTGPIGGGKSLAVAELAVLGAAIIDADAEGHELLREQHISAAIAEQFGQEVMVCGAVDRSALGRLVFADPEALARLNALVHSRLSRRIAEKLQALAGAESRPCLAVVEAAVYFLLPSFGEVDLVICVTASEDARRKRLVASGRFDVETASARVAAQRPLLHDWIRSDIVLHNDGTAAELRRTIHDLYRDRIRWKEAP